MITLSLKCYKCGKERSHNVTDMDLTNNLIGKFEFQYMHNSKDHINVVVCNDCVKKYKIMKEEVEEQARRNINSFFDKKEK